MKRFRYAVQTEQGEAHLLSVYENENLAQKIKDLKIIIARPCSTFAEAVKIVEAWKKEK